MLAYHGVVERYTDPRVEASFHLLADFRAQLAVLKKFRVVRLDELDAERAAGRVLPRVVITFDDGFANNTLAAELLAEAKLPATFFVATGNVDAQQTIWPTLLRLVLARGSARRITLAGIDYDLERDCGAFAAIRDTFKRLPSAERLARFDELYAQLRSGELGELVAQFPSIAMMSWRDVRELAAAGHAIGSHGRMHELQHADQPPALREQELRGSKSEIERAIEQQCDSFAFPNGTYHDGSAEEVRRCGYARAFTMVSRAAGEREDPMLLPRIVAAGGADQLLTKLFFGN